MFHSKEMRQSKHSNLTYYHQTPKHPRLMYCESMFERNMVRALDFDPMVKSYTTQPFTIAVRSNWRYTPDVLVTYHDNRTPTCIEFKPSVKLDDPRLLAKLKIYKSKIKSLKGFDFRVESEEKYTHYEFENHKFLSRYFKYPKHIIREFITLNPTLLEVSNYGELLALFSTKKLKTKAIATLAYGFGTIDLTSPIIPETLISWRM